MCKRPALCDHLKDFSFKKYGCVDIKKFKKPLTTNSFSFKESEIKQFNNQSITFICCLHSIKQEHNIQANTYQTSSRKL